MVPILYMVGLMKAIRLLLKPRRIWSGYSSLSLLCPKARISFAIALRRAHPAAVTVQRVVRGFLAHRHALRVRTLRAGAHAVPVLQMEVRAWLASRRAKEQQLEIAVRRLQSLVGSAPHHIEP